jgi:FAD:protein FMN transferase
VSRSATAGVRSAGAVRWSLWGSYAHLAVAEPTTLPAARLLADDLLERIGAACSRFRPDSDLGVANRHAGRWVEVDPLLVAAVRAALWAAELTDGIVDPCLGRTLVSLGYDDDLAVVRARPEPSWTVTPPAPLAPRGAWRDLAVVDEAVRVPAGVSLDLGATAKAWAADLVAQAVADAIGGTAVLSLGGDVRVAGPGGAAPTWPVRVSEAVDDLATGELVVVSGGLATSTTVVRRWRAAGADRHHLIDPATGRPAAAPYRTVTAGGGTCLAANTATTAAVVLGHRAPTWLATQGVTARLVARDGTVTTVGGWPAPTVEEDLS